MAEFTPQAREDIQGLILSGFGHLDHNLYLFLQIQEPKTAKVWLQNLIPEITTSKIWPKTPDGKTQKPDITLSIAFTYAGLKVLNLPQDTLDTFSREFIEGMTASYRSQLLGDTEESSPQYWDLGGSQNPEIHLLIILYGMTPELLLSKRKDLLQTFSGVAIVAEESGYRPPSEKEHFGFHDSISQPRIEGNSPKINPEDVNQVVKAGEFILGYPNQYNMLPSTPVVPIEADVQNLLPLFPANELPNFKDFGFNGTYLVYRKLAQQVAAFWQYIAQQSESHPEIMKILASKCVGRWPSGTPLVLSPDQDNPQMTNKNLFTYLPEDRKGFACPVGAHIRRTNPRDSFLEVPPEQSLNTSNRHRLLRRGALYGEPLYSFDDIENDRIPVELQDDGKPRGLQFFCLNGDIGRQFEFVQQTWSNNPKFNGLYDNKDPIIGDNQGSSHMEIPQQPIRKRLLELPRFVTVKGGGYFFVPSISAIKFLVS